MTKQQGVSIAYWGECREFPLGDVNVDGAVNGLDVDPFIIVLLDGPYQIEADMNLDGAVNGLDVNPFADAVISGGEDLSSLLRCGEQTVPEPSTLLLCIVALGVVGGWRKWSGPRSPAN
jgi:hypothetical protein